MTPIVELWNKIDLTPDPDSIMLEAASLPIEVDIIVNETISHRDKVGEKFESDGAIYNGDPNWYNDEYVTATTEETLLSKSVSSLSKTGAKGFKRKQYTVAASVKTETGFDDFMAILEVRM